MNFSITNNQLNIDLEWYEQLWAVTLTKRFEIPLSHIQDVTIAEPQSHWTELRAPGTFVPGIIKAGTYYGNRGKSFWYVTDQKNYLTLELVDEPYQRMVFTLPQNTYWLEQINQSKG